jgi:hypothetical protein
MDHEAFNIEKMTREYHEFIKQQMPEAMSVSEDEIEIICSDEETTVDNSKKHGKFYKTVSSNCGPIRSTSTPGPRVPYQRPVRATSQVSNNTFDMTLDDDEDDGIVVVINSEFINPIKVAEVSNQTIAQFKSDLAELGEKYTKIIDGNGIEIHRLKDKDPPFVSLMIWQDGVFSCKILDYSSVSKWDIIQQQESTTYEFNSFLYTNVFDEEEERTCDSICNWVSLPCDNIEQKNLYLKSINSLSYNKNGIFTHIPIERVSLSTNRIAFVEFSYLNSKIYDRIITSATVVVFELKNGKYVAIDVGSMKCDYVSNDNTFSMGKWDDIPWDSFDCVFYCAMVGGINALAMSGKVYPWAQYFEEKKLINLMSYFSIKFNTNKRTENEKPKLDNVCENMVRSVGTFSHENLYKVLRVIMSDEATPKTNKSYKINRNVVRNNGIVHQRGSGMSVDIRKFVYTVHNGFNCKYFYKNKNVKLWANETL